MDGKQGESRESIGWLTGWLLGSCRAPHLEKVKRETTRGNWVKGNQTDKFFTPFSTQNRTTNKHQQGESGRGV